MSDKYTGLCDIRLGSCFFWVVILFFCFRPLGCVVVSVVTGDRHTCSVSPRRWHLITDVGSFHRLSDLHVPLRGFYFWCSGHSAEDFVCREVVPRRHVCRWIDVRRDVFQCFLDCFSCVFSSSQDRPVPQGDFSKFWFLDILQWRELHLCPSANVTNKFKLSLNQADNGHIDK